VRPGRGQSNPKPAAANKRPAPACAACIPLRRAVRLTPWRGLGNFELVKIFSQSEKWLATGQEALR
jgi:hypothetical protein